MKAKLEPPACIVDREWRRSSGRVLKYTEVGNIGIMVTNNGGYYKDYANYMVWVFEVDKLRAMTLDQFNALDVGTAPVRGIACTYARKSKVHPWSTAWQEEFAKFVAKAEKELKDGTQKV